MKDQPLGTGIADFVPIMKAPTRCLFPNRLAGVLCAVALAWGLMPAPARAQTDVESTAVQVQVTELGLMRALLLLDESAMDMEDRLAERLTEVDFRLVPAAMPVQGRLTPERVRDIAEREDADMVLFAKTKLRELPAMQDFRIYEGEATAQIWIATTGELVASKTQRVKGIRSTDTVNAQRTATERSVDLVAADAIEMSLAKAHKLLAHEAVLVNVFSERGLLAIMEYIGKMDGVYHVRRRSFDRDTNEALVEIIGAPHSETFWRAYMEKMPKTKVNFALNPNQEVRNKYPSWFLPAGENPSGD